MLSVPPGITDFASLEFKEESRLLAAAAAEGAADPETVYVQKILPVKLDYYCRYVRQRSLWLDFKLVLRTLVAIWR
ncbi:sugar transferase [Desulfurispora thermophila]|uniref:sugar transferase n=1 Tax=Desulfurispora thermophila TaxID=265470 RepID=UPI00036ADD88